MKAIIHTSDDYYQHYVPLFAYCFHRLYPSVEIHATVYGSVDSLSVSATEGLPYLTMHEYNSKVPPAVGRFLKVPSGDVLIADADILFVMPGLIEYCQKMMKQFNTCYYAAHGAKSQPRRFPDSWLGEKERLCGAFVYVTQAWGEVTKVWRENTLRLFLNGKMQEYREEDEVILCNLCKMVNLPINQEKYFPLSHRGIHLGDFKPNMIHRFQNIGKMKNKMAENAAQAFTKMDRFDDEWIKLKEFICENDPEIKEIFTNLYWYLGRR